MTTFFTPERHGYAVRFSPFYKDLLAVATSQQYGLAGRYNKPFTKSFFNVLKIKVLYFCLLVGGGTLFILERTPVATLERVAVFEWPDGIFDVAWSEGNSDVAVTGSGDGYLQVWNLNHPSVSYKL